MYWVRKEEKEMERKGFVNNKFENWVKGFDLNNERWNRKENKSGRKCLWFGVGVDLGRKNYIYEGEKINNGLRKRINEIWGGEDWNSLLIYK